MMHVDRSPEFAARMRLVTDPAPSGQDADRAAHNSRVSMGSEDAERALNVLDSARGDILAALADGRLGNVTIQVTVTRS